MRKGFKIMNKIPLFKKDRLPWQILIYGTYATLCHAVAVYFFALCAKSSLLPAALTSLCAPMLEHTFITFAIVIAGAALTDCVFNKNQKDKDNQNKKDGDR